MEGKNENKNDCLFNHQNSLVDHGNDTCGDDKDKSFPSLSSNVDSNYSVEKNLSMSRGGRINENVSTNSAIQLSNIDNHAMCHEWNEEYEWSNESSRDPKTATSSCHHLDESNSNNKDKVESVISETINCSCIHDRSNVSLQQPTLFQHSTTRPKKRMYDDNEQSCNQYTISHPQFTCKNMNKICCDEEKGENQNSNGNNNRHEFSRKKRIISLLKIENESGDKPKSTTKLPQPHGELNSSKVCNVRQRPIAPSLSMYLQNGGTHLYAPRPEWYLPPVSLRPFDGFYLDNSNSNNKERAVKIMCNNNNHFWPKSSSSRTSNHDNILSSNSTPMDFDHYINECYTTESNVERGTHNDIKDNNYDDDHNIDNVHITTSAFAKARKYDVNVSSNYPRSHFDYYLNARVMHPQDQNNRWNFIDTRDNNHNETEGMTFENGYNTALHLAINSDATQASMELIYCCGYNGVSINFPNRKGVTPLILAAQKGNISVVKLLLESGANSLASTLNGTTALIQASHFGKNYKIIPLLLQYGANVEQANYKQTTALMRASQEGHEEIVRLLLQYKSNVNRKNHEKMSALMLASQRGHSNIVKMLIQAGAEIDMKTAQESTSLMLACKREHLEVVKILVSSGCELMLQDSRGRTAFDTAKKSNLTQFLKLLTPEVQIYLMKCEERKRRSHFLVKMWNLLQQERATVALYIPASVNNHENRVLQNSAKSSSVQHHLNTRQDQINTGPKREISIHERSNTRRDMTIHEICIGSLDEISTMSKSDKMLVCALSLPAPLMEMIVSYLPLPRLWEKRLTMLTNRCHIDTKSTLNCTLDLIDDILSEGGFEKACDIAGITPPPFFDSWRSWKAWGIKCDSEWIKNELAMNRDYDEKHANSQLSSIRNREDTENYLENETRINDGEGYEVNTNSVTELNNRRVRQKISPCPIKATTLELRRKANFFQILTFKSPMLTRTLSSPPFNLPDTIIRRLKINNDVQSLVRRLGNQGIHFEAQTVFELIMLASQLILWHSSIST